MYCNTIEKDHNGRIIYQERDDGFYELITYHEDGSIKRIETHYPAGQVEIERFINNKRDS